MKRTKFSYEIRLTDALVDKFLAYPNYGTILALYVFYRRVAMRQCTNQPHATDSYCMHALHIGSVKFYEAKKVLKKMKLIEQIQVGRTLSRFGKPYVRLIPVQDNVVRTKRVASGTEHKIHNPECPHELQYGKDYYRYRSRCMTCEQRDSCVDSLEKIAPRKRVKT